jgi:general secretion pathway protein G
MIRRDAAYQATTGDLLRRAAFTLMEMLVVVAIIVVLAGVGTVTFIKQLENAKISATKIRAKEISSACEMYYVDTGAYPAGLQVLLMRDPVTMKGPWLKNAEDILSPINGQPFQYDQSGTIGMQNGNTTQIPDVYTLTPDGQQIGNWKAK